MWVKSEGSDVALAYIADHNESSPTGHCSHIVGAGHDASPLNFDPNVY